jgi:hypothetical protein
MGFAALFVLWGNTLLITWATVQELAALRARAPHARRDAGLVSFGLGAIVGGAAGCSALALSAPVFGPVSTVGGAACLAFFLLVQPLGTALRDRARAPAPSRL